MELFTSDDFKVFGLKGFNERMAAIMLQIRPKLASIGGHLAPKLSPMVDTTLYVHVAKHARRTVNPPDDTWAAMGANPRGYKDIRRMSISRSPCRVIASGCCSRRDGFAAGAASSTM